MKLKKLTEHVHYLPPDDFKDRPLLGYVCGEKYSLAIDGGFSPDHVKLFYDAIEAEGLRLPDYTALTHWHWDHTLGLPAIRGELIASKKTDELLAEERERLKDPEYDKKLRRWYYFVDDEFPGVPIPEIRTADIEFEDSYELDLGGVTAKLWWVEAPHTPDSTLIYIPEDKVLFLGDASLGDFETGGRVDLKKMEKLNAIVEETGCSKLLLGHFGKKTLMEYLRAY